MCYDTLLKTKDLYNQFRTSSDGNIMCFHVFSKVSFIINLGYVTLNKGKECPAWSEYVPAETRTLENTRKHMSRNQQGSLLLG